MLKNPRPFAHARVFIGYLLFESRVALRYGRKDRAGARDDVDLEAGSTFSTAPVATLEPAPRADVRGEIVDRYETAEDEGDPVELRAGVVAVRTRARTYLGRCHMLMPGPTDTEFFERADMTDTKVGTEKKQPANAVAQLGFDAMMRGDGDVIAGFENKLQVAIAHVLPSGAAAELHRAQAAPGTGKGH